MMPTKSQINSGFRNIAISDVNGNVIGTTVQQLVVPGPANISIGTGSNGQALSTNGSGTLSWITVPGIIANAEYLVNGTSNVFLANSGPITFSVNGVPNVAYLTSNSITNTANLSGISNVILSGGYTNNYIQTDGNGNLSWGPDQYIIPDGGYGLGRSFARGTKLWANGSGQDAYSLGEGNQDAPTRFTRNKNIIYDNLPNTVPALSYFTKIYDCNAAIYALGNNGLLYSTGTNTYGSLGLVLSGAPAWSLTPVTNSAVYGPGITIENFWAPDDITGLASDRFCSCIVQVMDNGTRKYYGFGYNLVGNLGIGNSSNQFLPVEITTLRNKNLVSVSMTTVNTMVVTDTGEVWGAGNNSNGQLGTGLTATSDVFVRATLAAGSALITNAVEAQISVINSSAVIGYVAFIRLSDGTVVGAGLGLDNRLGTGTTSNQTRFTPVLTAAATPLTNIVKIRSRCADTMALDSAGNLWAWGLNVNGMWGNGEAAGTVSAYAKTIQTAVSDFWINSQTSGFNRSMIHTRTTGITYGSGSNAKLQLGVDSLSTSNVLTATPIYYCEKGEYAVKVKTIGIGFSLNLADQNNAIMHLTNRNRVYLTGSNTNAWAATYTYASNLGLPTPITDIEYY